MLELQKYLFKNTKVLMKSIKKYSGKVVGFGNISVLKRQIKGKHYNQLQVDFSKRAACPLGL